VIAVLIPAYNAQDTVGAVVAGAIRHADRVVVVDDGSTDRTASHAAAAGAELLGHRSNRGKGAALRTGFEHLIPIGAEAVITLDADMQHDPEDIPLFREAFARRRADLIIGSRQAGFDGMSRGRRLGNRFSCGALRFFTGLDLPDSQSGFRLYAAEFLRSLSLKRHAYDAEMEVLLRAARGQRRVEIIAIHSHTVDGQPTSYFRPWLDTYRICRTVVLFSGCEF